MTKTARNRQKSEQRCGQRFVIFILYIETTPLKSLLFFEDNGGVHFLLYFIVSLNHGQSLMWDFGPGRKEMLSSARLSHSRWDFQPQLHPVLMCPRQEQHRLLLSPVGLLTSGGDTNNPGCVALPLVTSFLRGKTFPTL